MAINATTSQGLQWVNQQIRQVTAWCETPRFLVPLPVLPISLRSSEHGADNDAIFGQFRDRTPRGEKGLRYRCQLDLWLKEVLAIQGLPIPYCPGPAFLRHSVDGTTRAWPGTHARS